LSGKTPPQANRATPMASLINIQSEREQEERHVQDSQG
jgi:hypothetical protein